MPTTMDVQPRIERLEWRLATSGTPVYASVITMGLLAATGNWHELANNAILSLVLPEVTALLAFLATSTLAILGSILSFFGLSAKEVAHNVSLAIGILISVLPIVGLWQALTLLG